MGPDRHLVIGDSSTVVWIDESARSGALGIAYVVVGVRNVGLDLSAFQRLDSMLLPGQRYVHWRDESSRRRRELVAVFNELALDVTVAFAEGVGARRQEEARHLCLVELIREAAVGPHRLDRVAIEGRGKDLDLRDRSTVLNECRVSMPGAAPHVDFVAKPASPLLWVADAVASMASMHFADHEGSDFWWRELRVPRLTMRRATP